MSFNGLHTFLDHQVINAELQASSQLRWQNACSKKVAILPAKGCASVSIQRWDLHSTVLSDRTGDLSLLLLQVTVTAPPQPMTRQEKEVAHWWPHLSLCSLLLSKCFLQCSTPNRLLVLLLPPLVWAMLYNGLQEADTKSCSSTYTACIKKTHWIIQNWMNIFFFKCLQSRLKKTHKKDAFTALEASKDLHEIQNHW